MSKETNHSDIIVKLLREHIAEQYKPYLIQITKDATKILDNNNIINAKLRYDYGIQHIYFIATSILNTLFDVQGTPLDERLDMLRNNMQTWFDTECNKIVEDVLTQLAKDKH